MTADPAAESPEPTITSLVAARFADDEPSGEPSPSVTSALEGQPGEATLRAMLGHRTCRSFADEPLDDDVLDLVMAAAFSAPSKSDLQQCSVIVVDDPTRRAAIAELIPTMPWIVEASRFLVFCGDSRRIRGIGDRVGIPFANDHLDAVLNAAADAAIHLGSFIWAAESVGLGTCPISVVRNHIEAVSEILELPDHVFPLAGMCVGWPQQLRRLSPRLPLGVTVHRDRYDDTDAATLIDSYDRRRAGSYQPAPEDQLDTDKWGTVDFYGWSQEKARMTARLEREQLARFLVDRGFDLS